MHSEVHTTVVERGGNKGQSIYYYRFGSGPKKVLAAARHKMRGGNGILNVFAALLFVWSCLPPASTRI